MMVDFHACSWPRPDLNADDTSLALYFDAMNEAPLEPLLSHLRQNLGGSSSCAGTSPANTRPSTQQPALQQQQQQQQRQRQRQRQQQEEPEQTEQPEALQRHLQRMQLQASGQDDGRSASEDKQFGAGAASVSREQPDTSSSSSAGDRVGSPGLGTSSCRSGGHQAVAGGVVEAPQLRPPLITFSHFLPHQVPVLNPTPPAPPPSHTTTTTTTKHTHTAYHDVHVSRDIQACEFKHGTLRFNVL